MNRRLVGGTLGLLVLVGGWLGFRRISNEQSETPLYEPVELIRTRLETVMEATGVVEPRNRLEIKPPIGGRIDEVLVEEGQQVVKGDIVARMSSTERASLLDAAKARGPEVLHKWEDIYKSTALLAPLDGAIIARNTEPGQTVTTADPILVLSDRLIVSARVDETDIGFVKVGQPARITLDAYRDVTVQGVVRRIAYDAETVNNVTIYAVEVEPTDLPAFMKSGMTATVGFLIDDIPDALTLPSDAVSTEEGKSVVLIDDGDPGTPPERYRVLTGLTSEGRIEILAGLQGHEQVVRKTYRRAVAREGGSTPFMPGPPSRKK